ncbi:MAG: hypothetical protein IKN12_06380 [Selenomonadaceae bacterium]|nr:hypothetical protein [Selenomonadaceae bacterium]
MGKAEKILLAIVVFTLMINCVYLNFRVNELESRISIIESDQAFLAKNMNEALNIARELVIKIGEK